jgi:hypothetical protein
LLVVEVGSPSTRRVDRTRKLSDYRAGGARCYLTVELPARGDGHVVFEVHDFAAGEERTSLDTCELIVGSTPVRLDLSGPIDSRTVPGFPSLPTPARDRT